MATKTGQLKEGSSRCDYCSSPVAVIHGNRAYCARHAPQPTKVAAAPTPTLKTAAETMADLHTL